MYPDRHLTNKVLPPLLLFIVSLSLYSVTYGFELLATWDDKLYLIRNETITAVTLDHIGKAFTGYYVGNYAPLHILSYMLDYSLWGLNAACYHAENTLFHALNGVLFYLLLRRLDFSIFTATSAAWIFLFHPAQVETVAWVSQRKNLLAMFFFLLTMISFQTYRQHNRCSFRAYLATIFCFTAAALCKSVVVITPILLLLYEQIVMDDKWDTMRSRLRDKIPFFLVALLIGGMTLLSQSPEYGGGRREYYGGSALATFYTMAPVLVSYLRDCFWPFGLIPFYYTLDIRLKPDIQVISSIAILAVTAGFGFWLRQHMRHLLFWYGLFFITLLPVMQIVPIITLKHDRYLYFPMLGFAVVAAEITRHFSVIGQKAMKLASHCFIAAVFILLPVAAFQQTLHWRNDITLWSRAVAVEPENRLGWRLLSMAYSLRNDSAKAKIAFDRYMELYNRAGTIHYYEEK